MGGVLKEITDYINKENPKAYKLGETAIALVNDATTVVGFVRTLIGLFSTQSESLAQLVDKLLNRFEKLESQLAASEKIALLRDVSDKINKARAIRNATMATLSSGGNFSDSDRTRFLLDTDEVVMSLGDPSYWLRSFVDKFVYSDIWSGNLVPPNDGFIVFEYRYTLAAYLEAISIRMLVLLAMVPQFKEDAEHRQQIGRIAARLEDVHNTIRNGIVEIRAPTFEETEYDIRYPYGTAGGSASVLELASSWDRKDQVLRQYGAIERYAGFGLVESYPADRFPSRENVLGSYAVASEAELRTALLSGVGSRRLLYRNFLLLHRIGTISRLKRVYIAVGLPAVFDVVERLKALATGVVFKRPVNPNSGWSIRELDNLVASTLLDQPSTASGNDPVSLKNLISLIGAPLNGSVRQALEG